MPALVIGGSGFLGRALIKRLIAQGESVAATSKTLAHQFHSPRLRWHIVDFGSFNGWESLLEGFTTVYHLGWSSVPSTADGDPLLDASNNIIGSVRLLRAAKSKSLRLIFASSGGTVYGAPEVIPATERSPEAPINAYGISKVTVERYIQFYGKKHELDYIILRFGNFYGPDQALRNSFGAVATFCSNSVRGRPCVVFGDGNVVRDYILIDDAVDAILLASSTNSPHRVFNIGSGVGRSLNEVIRSIERISGQTLLVQYVESRPFDVPISILDIGLAGKELHWHPKTSFDEGIARTLASFGGG